MTDKLKPESIRPLVIMGAVIVLILSACTYVIWKSFPEMTDRGAFGDLFGAVNALFSGLAFAGILYALHLQRRELSIQREELRAQREELELTRAELERAATAQESSHRALLGQMEAMSFSAQATALETLVRTYSAKMRETDRDSEKRRLADLHTEYTSKLELCCRALTDVTKGRIDEK